MVSVKIVGVQFDPEAETSAVLLGDTGPPTRVLPIMIGTLEARSIAAAAAGWVPPRPGTHDLMVSVMSAAGAELEEVAVTELIDGVFHAELFVEMSTGLQRVSARPSDAIALAMRVGAPIVVGNDVLERAAVVLADEPAELLSDDQIDEVVSEFHQFLATTSASDFALHEPPPRDERGSGEA